MISKFKGRAISLAVASLSIVAIPFLFNSCDNGVGPLLGMDGKFTAACKAFQAQEKYPSVFAHKKLLLGMPNTLPAGQYAKATIDSDMVLPAGKRLVALVDTQCLVNLRKDQEWLAHEPLSLQISSGKEILSYFEVQPFGFELENSMSISELNDQVEADPCVRGVGPQKTYHLSSLTSTYNDPGVIYQSHLVTLRAEEAAKEFYHSEYGIMNPNIKVAVIDSGISFTHKDLAGSIWRHGPNGNLWGINAISLLGSGPADYNPSDISPFGHGSHISGIIAATANNNLGITGIAGPGIKIMAVKVFYENDQKEIITTTDVLVHGLIWALTNEADVINFSLGRLVDGTQEPLDDPIYQEAMAVALNAGAVVVTATGNSSTQFPAQELNDSTFTVIPARYAERYNGMINVGSIDIDDQGNVLGKSSFSHYSKKYVEIAAPGNIVSRKGIYSTLPVTASSPDGSYGYLPGTSQAAPMVTAAAALTMALFKTHFGVTPPPAEVERLILKSARKDSLLANHIKDGNILDLKSLVDTIHMEYPETKGGESKSLSSSSSSCR